MERMKRTEFAALMTRLRSCYQNAVADHSLWLASITTYWDLCQEYPADDVRAAFAVAWRRHPDWMPSCGQLIGLIEGAASNKAADAWPEVLALAKRSSGDHQDPVAREAIKAMGGGARLGAMRADELLVWGRKEFLELYVQIAHRVETADARSSVRDAVRGPNLPQDAPAPRLGP